VALVFDRRAALGAVPVTHAFIVGISEYTFLPASNEPPNPNSFGLKRLASPALSAGTVCEWLVAHADGFAKPLATCWLLTAPSAVEAPLMPNLPVVPGVTGAAPGAGDWTSFVDNITAWRFAASINPQDTTLLYYAGHGLQRQGVPLLTLADFTNPAAGGRLMRSVDLANIVDGMAPSAAFPAIARTQFYFIDACREEIAPNQLTSNTGSVFDALPGYDDRATPIFQATYPDAVALTRIGQPTDFCIGLLQAFERGAENRDGTDPARRWPVTTFTLHTALSNYFTALKTGQYAPLGGVAKNEKLLWLNLAPKVDLSLAIDPDPAIDTTSITLSGGVNHNQAAARQNHPYRVTIPAGVYKLTATSTDNAYLGFADESVINQQNSRWLIRMEAAS